MPDKKEMTDAEKKEKEKLRKEKEDLKEEKINFKREVLVSLGYSEEKANKHNSIEVLNALIEDEKERNSAKNEGIPPPDQKLETKKIVVNAGSQTVSFPDGSKKNAEPVERINEDLLFRLTDPMKVPRNILKYSERARVNTLPPDDEHPYHRVIA